MLSVYDMQYKRTAYLTNHAESGIHYEDDELTTSIPDGIYTFSLKIPKDTPLTAGIDIGYYIETRTRQGKLLLMAITEMNEDNKYKNLYCVDSSILVVNNYVEAIETPKTPERAEYYVKQALESSDVELKLVESTEAKTVSFGSEQRVLARLQAIAKEFNLELIFDTDFIPGHVPKRYVSLVKKRVEDYEGFRVSSDDFLLGVQRKKSMMNVATKMRVRGKQKPTETKASTTATATPIQQPEPQKDTFIETAVERAFAVKALGRRYQWGGNGNPSWDCSGFMQEAFKAAGKLIDHRWTTYTMWSQQGGNFKRISRSELKRGDMIMYDTGYTTPGDVNHVGLYLGPTLSSPNSVIHAGDPVGLTQRADSMTIIGYVRVVRPSLLRFMATESQYLLSELMKGGNINDKDNI